MKNTTAPYGKKLRMALSYLPMVLVLFCVHGLIAQTPLTITCPPDVVLDCTQDIYDPAITGDATVDGGCDPASTFYYYDDYEIVSGCSYELARIYYAVNSCGETDSCIQSIIVNDDFPMIVNCPADFTLATCSSSLFPSQTGGLPSFTDNCSEPEISWNDVILGNPDLCCDAYTIERTWTMLDQCGTPATCLQLIFVPGQICDDGDPCTLDECINGACVSTPILCDDGDPCTTDACVDGVCIFTQIICDDGDPCTTDDCIDGVCVFTPVICDDNDPCTTDDCINGVCVFTEIVCDDGDPCTTDACLNGVCVFTPVNCDDNDPTTLDECIDGVCVHTAMPCNDNNPCTLDEIVDGVCTHTPIICDDGDPCTEDSCVEGICMHTPKTCDDEDPCTLDYCDGNGHCQHLSVDCADDGDPCTYEVCEGGICLHIPVECTTEDLCMIAVCVNGICELQPITCDDGDPCTLDECVNGVCVFTPIVCDDSDPMTIDECIDGICVHTPIPCDDNNPCTIDVIQNGVCTHVQIVCDDENPCTEDVCINGNCQYTEIPGCGNQPEPPEANCDFSAILWVDLFHPDYNGPFLNNIYLVPASQFDDGSTSESATPLMEVKRSGSNINFDWTTQGACVDLTRNFVVTNADRGILYRTCLPVTPYDFFRWRSYSFRISDEYGSDECTGYFYVIPYWNWNQQGYSLSEYLPTADHLGFAPDAHSHFSAYDNPLNLETESITSLDVFPNPGDQEVYVSWNSTDSESIEISVSDFTGKQVIWQKLESEIGKHRIKLDARSIPQGTYIIQIKSLNQFQSAVWMKFE